MFYEFKHPMTSDYFKVETNSDFSYPSHLHHCFEIVAVTEGEMSVSVNNREYLLSQGDALFIFPNQIHSMSTPSHSSHILCLFAQNLVTSYARTVLPNVPVNGLFRPEFFYLEKMQELMMPMTDILEIKGLLYSLCGLFHKKAEYTRENYGSNELLFNIFKFIEQEYNKDCSLNELARFTGYNYSYLSRYFKQIVGISFNDYVNQYRVSSACYLLANSQMSILEVSTECGFNSLRSLNRNFREQLDTTPAEYRREKLDLKEKMNLMK